MKFIKYAVGLVIALSVIPLVVVTVNNLDEPRLRTVEFEVVDVNGSTITFSENTFDNIHTLAIVDTNDMVSNLLVVSVNSVELLDSHLMYEEYDYIAYNFFTDDDALAFDGLQINDKVSLVEGTLQIGDKWSMTFEVPNPTPPLVKLLVGFAPLLFVGGILLFMLNKRKLA